MYYVYMLTSETGDLYIGCTGDLRKRLREHNAGEVRSTKGKRWKLNYYEAYESLNLARRREYRLKHHGQAKRQLLSRIKE